MTISKLELRGVSKVFGDAAHASSVRALDDTSFSIEDGEFVSIVGPSGCGKSTLFSIIAGLVPPTTGTILMDGIEPKSLLGSVGLMPQRDLLMPWKTVIDNVAVGLTLGGMTKRDARVEAGSYFEEFGLNGFEKKWPSELSGGMKQRAALLRTFLTGHGILLLDEPFGALDALTRRSMQSWLLEVWGVRKRTILFITHDVDEAILLSDRVYVMSGRPGRIALDVRIDLRRPRDTGDTVGEKFNRYKAQLIEPLERAARAVAQAAS